MTMWGLPSLQCLVWLMCSSLTSGVSFLLVFCWCIIPWKTRCHPWYACQANKGNLALFKFCQVSSLADNQYNQSSHCGANHLLQDKHYASLHFNTCRACEYITVCSLHIITFLIARICLLKLLHPIHIPSPLVVECCLSLSPLWRMNGLVSVAILCPSRRSGVCAASHWSSKWAGNGAGGPGCWGGGGRHWADQLGTMDQTPTREMIRTSNAV